MNIRTLARIALGVSVVATGVVALAAPAVAVNDAYLSPTTSAYTDQTAPAKSLATTNGAWVGSWTKNSVTHTSRAYYTFDLTAYKGGTISQAIAAGSESVVNDCSTTRDVEVWLVDTPTGKITWANAPAEKKLLFSGADTWAGCPSGLGFDLLTAARQAIAGTGFLTFEVRVPDGHEADVAYGREFDAWRLSLTYNHAPNPPTNLMIDGHTCGDTPFWITETRPRITADATDPDTGSDLLTGTFEVYPVGHPEQASDLVSNGGYSPASLEGGVNDGVLVDGGKYVLRVKANDGTADSKWSATCRFNVDLTPPTATVTVTSTDYPNDGLPHGGVNIPGTFHLSAGGNKDIVGFSYGQYGEKYVAANKPGGTADVTYAPTMTFGNRLEVQGIDEAGWRGPETDYEYVAKDTEPLVTDADPDALFRAPHHLTFTPNMDNVVSYEVQLNNGDVSTVAADPDGSASLTIVPDQEYADYLAVTSVTAAGLRSATAYSFLFADPTPTITSDVYVPDGSPHGGVGVPSVFTFAPRVTDIVSYTYAFDNDTPTTIDADASGGASVTWAPPDSLSHTLTVTSTSVDGYVSPQASFPIYVTPDSPTLSADLYQPYVPSGGPGQTGHFTFTAKQAGAVSFVYTIGSDAEKTVPVGADGTATIAYTPTTGGWFDLQVHSVTAAGVASATTYSQLTVNQFQPTITETDSAGVYTFTITATLPGSTTFVYTLDSGDAVTVPVGADGTAQVTWTPEPGAVHWITVHSVTDDGYTSSDGSYYYYVSG